MGRRSLFAVVALAWIASACAAPAPEATRRPPARAAEPDPVLEVGLHYYTMEAGVTGVVTRLREPTLIRTRLPDGWVAAESSVTNEAEEGDEAVTISLWGVDAVFIDPCDPIGYHAADPPLMRTVDGLADAFTTWWQQGRGNEWWAGNPPLGLPRATDPIDTTVSGFRARYLEVRIPNTVDVGACSGRYATWRNADGVERRHQPGDVSRIWIVEVGPRPDVDPPTVPATSTPLLVIDASSSGQLSPAALAELEKVIDAFRIEAPRAIP